MKLILQATLLGAILLLVPAAARAGVQEDLVVAAKFFDLEGVKYLLSKGANVNAADSHGMIAIFGAAGYPGNIGNLGVVKYLVETAKADVNARMQTPKGSLSILQVKTLPYILDYLREHGAK